MTDLSLTAPQMEMFNKWRFIPLKVLGQFRNDQIKYNRDDYKQIGNIALIKCIKGFKPELGNSFKTYAFCAIRNEMRGYLTEDRVITVPGRFVDDKKYLAEMNSVTTSQITRKCYDDFNYKDNSVEVNDWVHKNLEKLDKRARFIIEKRFFVEKPLKLREIGSVLGLTKERVRQILEETLERMRENE